MYRDPSNMEALDGDRPDSVWSLAAFWVVAFIGSGLFAAVLIAPKWENRLALQARVRYQATQNAYEADLNEHFRRVIEAFRNDPEFGAEVARFALGYVSPNEERLPAPIQNWAQPKQPPPAATPPNMLDPFVRLFAHDRVVRRTATVAAAVFVVFSLAFFNANPGNERQ
jgi:hypothetical protein